MKYIIRIVIAILCFVIGLFACELCKKKLFFSQLNHPTKKELSSEDSLKVKILQTGDTIAYTKLKEAMKEEGFPYKIWFYSIIMAKQYHFLPASYDVDSNLIYVYNQQIERKEVDLKTQKLISLFATKGNHKSISNVIFDSLDTKRQREN